jgi:hypothetical protein
LLSEVEISILQTEKMPYIFRRLEIFPSLSENRKKEWSFGFLRRLRRLRRGSDGEGQQMTLQDFRPPLIASRQRASSLPLEGCD